MVESGTMAAIDVRTSMKESVPGHFRIWKDVYESLEEEATKRKVSLNTLVNQVLSTHTRDDVLYEEVGFIKMTRDTLRVALSLIPDDKLCEFGALAANTGADARMLARDDTMNIDAVREELRFFSRSGWFSINEAKKNGREVISLLHDFGPRGSLAFGPYVTGLFALVGVRPKVRATSSSVTIEF